MKIILGIGSLLLTACAFADAPIDKKPNILIIVADDLGWGDVGYHNPEIITPNIDQLANDGIILNRFYVAPMCSPTRSGLMTGRYPDRYGLRTIVVRPWFDYGLDTNEKILPQYMADAGYSNRGIVGKWHLGHSQWKYYPLERGLTNFYGHLNGAIDYFDHTREGELDWHEGYETSYDEGYSTDLITEKAIEYIHEYKDSPFFLYVAYNAPHSPLQAQEEYLLKYGYDENQPAFQSGKGKGNTLRQTFCAMVTNMDAGIGKILMNLKDLNIDNNTIVFFLSDNGGQINLGGYNGDLRGGKLTEWEGGVRVPAIVKWPAQFSGGKLTNQVTGFVDILPTLIDITGRSVEIKNELDGISILPILKADKDNIQRNLYLGCGAIVNQNWKLILKDAERGLSAMRINEDMLFRIDQDPNENINVINDYPQVFVELKDILSSYMSIEPTMVPPPDVKPPEFLPPEEWKPEGKR
jgi:arylsulfatase B